MFGTSFTIFDNGKNPTHGPGHHAASKKFDLRKELAAVFYVSALITFNK